MSRSVFEFEDEKDDIGEMSCDDFMTFLKKVADEGPMYLKELADKTSNVGKIIYGFCNGYFGREDYEDKIIVFETESSICCRYVNDELYIRKGWLTCANFDNSEEKQKYIDIWSKENER